jgi:peroxiredoxin Q/BCP
MAQLLEIGNPAPDFSAIDQNGQTHTLGGYKGKKVILYFYPKDDTPGCTAESCNLRDNYDSLLEDGFVVLGVSPDDSASHKAFIEKYQLPFPLLADTDKTLLKAYGAWGERNLYGKISEGVLRSTFIIDEAGNLLKVFKKVDTAAHTEQIRKALATK